MADDQIQVLFVDDESKVLGVAEKMLAGERYKLLTATDVEEAMAALDGKGPVAVVISDNRMPTMRGTEFFKKIKTLYPDTVRVLMTAHYDSQLIEDVVNTGEAYRYLKKPLDFNLVKQVIEAGIERYQANLQDHRDAKKLSLYGEENGRLMAEAEELKRKVVGLTRLRKSLVVAMAVAVVAIAAAGLYPLWGKRTVISVVNLDNWRKFSNGTAYDTRTGLTWMTQDFRIIEGRPPENWHEAVAWVEKMNRQKWGGHDDWRVPSISEYQMTFAPKSDRVAFDVDVKHPVAYPRAFEDGGGYGYWSLEEGGAVSARNFFFIGGYSKTEKKDFTHPSISIRLVRDKPA